MLLRDTGALFPWGPVVPGCEDRLAAGALRFALNQFAQQAFTPGPARGLARCVEQAGSRARAASRLISDRRFRLAFQPVVHLSDRRVHHFEALLRPWRQPEAAPFSTQEFVSFSEAIGLSEELDVAVLDEVAAELVRVPGSAVAVNVSGLSLESPAFRERALALAARCDGRLLVELTETARIENVAGAAESIDQLRAAGVPVCLDDLGAGGAGFRYLRDFRVDYVKIDGAYVHGAPRDARDRRLVMSMLELSRSLGARVIAEMIETEEQARLMRELGVELGQGWLLGRAGSLPGLG